MDNLNHLTFGELRKELTKCKNNEVKSKLIRCIMYKRYLAHIKMKQAYEHKKKLKKEAQQIINDIQSDEPFDLSSLPDQEDNSEENPGESLDDNRNIKLYDRDKANSHLMERLNSDLDIRKIKNSSTKPAFVPPFVDNPGDNFAAFKSKKKLNNKPIKG